MTVAIPVTPPPEIPFGIRKEVQLQQYKNAPNDIRIYSLRILSLSFFTLANDINNL